MEVEKSVSWVADRENHVCPAQLNEPMPFSVQQNIGVSCNFWYISSPSAIFTTCASYREELALATGDFERDRLDPLLASFT